MSDPQIFEDTFQITSINNEKYDRVSRISGTSVDNTSTMTLDINHELFTPAIGDSVQVMLATTLSLTANNKGEEERDWRNVAKGEQTLADLWEYVCYGKVYKFEDGGEGGIVKMYTSFGGLLLYIEGPWKKLSGCRKDAVYLLCRKQ